MQHTTNALNNDPTVSNIVSWFIGAVIFTIGALNLLLVHPVPGTVFLLLSLLYVPAFNTLLRKTFGFAVPLAAKITLGIVVVWFTLGVSDLGDMMDKL